MMLLRIFVCYGGAWDQTRYNYVEGSIKGLKIKNDITCSEQVSLLPQRLNIDPTSFEIHTKHCYNLLIPTPPIDIVDDDDLSFFLEGIDTSQMLLFVMVTSNDTHGVEIDNMY